jgi:hypothetical protein
MKPIDDSFEDAWKKAFDEASLVPPNAVWENIEKSLPSSNLDLKHPKSGSNTIAKFTLSASIVLITSFGIYKLINQPTILKNSNKNHETITSKPIQPAPLESNIQQQIVADNPIVNTQKPVKILKLAADKPVLSERKAPVEITGNSEGQFFENAVPIESAIPKNTIKLTEVLPHKLKQNNIRLQIPELVFPFDSQNTNVYFDPNLLPIENKKKAKFWENFKVRGSIGVSGGMGVNRNAVDSPKK